MGEIADMMLDGTLCEGCGEYLGGSASGFPRYCAGCRPSRAALDPRQQGRPKPFQCSCGKRLVNAQALTDHAKAKRCKPVVAAQAST